METNSEWRSRREALIKIVRLYSTPKGLKAKRVAVEGEDEFELPTEYEVITEDDIKLPPSGDYPKEQFKEKKFISNVFGMPSLHADDSYKKVLIYTGPNGKV